MCLAFVLHGSGPFVADESNPLTSLNLDAWNLEPWKPGTPEPWQSWKPATVEPWNPADPWGLARQHCNLGTLEPAVELQSWVNLSKHGVDHAHPCRQAFFFPNSVSLEVSAQLKVLPVWVPAGSGRFQ